jgi:hypothetical protein
MSDKPIEEVQSFKTDDLKLACFLLARGCRVKDKKLRDDNRVDFFVIGNDVFDLVKEHEMGSPNTLIAVHLYDSKMEFLRDICSRVKREQGSHRRT